MHQADPRRSSDRSGRGAEGGASRRGFLLSGAAAVLAVGAGTALGVVWPHSHHTAGTPAPPADLTEAAAAERALLNAVDRAATARSVPAARLAVIRSNHQAHLEAIQAALELATGPTPPAAATS